MEKSYLPAIVVIILLILSGFTLMTIEKTDQIPTALAFLDNPPPQVKILPSTIQIDKSELKHCCDFTVSHETKGCWLIKKYDCEICEPYCLLDETD